MIYWQKIRQSESSVLKTLAYLKRNQCNALRCNMVCARTMELTR